MTMFEQRVECPLSFAVFQLDFRESSQEPIEIQGDELLGIGRQGKAAIDRHLEGMGMPVSYTNVFWGGRSEIKPSEISPLAYAQWQERVNAPLPA